MGWDLSRATYLCSMGYLAGIYTYDEAIDKAFEIGEIIQHTFTSWEDFWESYMSGYLFWGSDIHQYEYRYRIVRRLLDNEISPVKLKWYMCLGCCEGEIRGKAI